MRKNKKTDEFLRAFLGFKSPQSKVNYLYHCGFSTKFADDFMTMYSKVDTMTFWYLTNMFFNEG